jgi:hypothetical protein
MNMVPRALMMLVLLSACQTGVILPSTLGLKWHETQTISGFEIRLEGVNDSRCPINAVCIWEDDGAVSISLKDLATGQIRNLELHTNQTVGSDSVKLVGITVKMLELNPFPGTVDVSKLPEAYTVLLSSSAEKP